jgi:transposase InsO family protein
MKKEEIRKEFFKLRIAGHSYFQCKSIMKAVHSANFSVRTLKRWSAKLDKYNWDLKDKSTKPNTIYYKVNENLKENILTLRTKTGWGEDKLALYIPLSHTTINSILNNNNLCRDSHNKGKRKKWVRWQRHHPNSLWQIDHTDEQNKFNCYTLSVLDDCSRYSLALVKSNRVTTELVIHILEELIKKHGKPKQILTDNGSAYGLNSRHSKFDIWCRRKGIYHIRTKVHSPTTNGKVERLFKTMDDEMEFCNNNLDNFRMRYNHFRPHSSLDNKTPADVYFAFHMLF